MMPELDGYEMTRPNANKYQPLFALFGVPSLLT